jgi:hypothetical protein
MVATAWHWIDADQRYQLAARLLKPGGHLAFWSVVLNAARTREA